MSTEADYEKDRFIGSSIDTMSSMQSSNTNLRSINASTTSIIHLEDPSEVISSNINSYKNSNDTTTHKRHKTYDVNQSNTSNKSIKYHLDDSALFDLNKPHSFNVPLLKGKNNQNLHHRNNRQFQQYQQYTYQEDRKRHSTFSGIGGRDPRRNYQHDLADKFSKKRFERLNFEITTTEVKHRETWDKRNNWWGKQIQARGLWKWCMCLAIGGFTGTCMFLISIAIEALVGMNLKWAQDGLIMSFGDGFARFLGLNCLFALISGSLVSFIAPPAAGSGIPDVKGWLNGSAVPGLFRMKTFIVKLVGVVFSVSAKFIIGKVCYQKYF